MMAVALTVAACGGSGGGEGSFGSGQTTSTSTDATTTDGSASESETGAESSSSVSTSEGSGSSGDAPDGDPGYPPPTPVGELGMCPDGFLGPITFDGTGWGCIPACDAEGLCPEALTGDAPGECATNPQSSATPCMDSTDCEIEGEMCGNAGMDLMACLLPPSHCILRCDDGEACPDAMTCAAAIGICQYVP
jgi:hypothetical protein